MLKTKSLRTRLFIWYGGSVTLVALFFWFGIHILSIPYGTEIFISLLILLSLVGFLMIRKITDSLSSLTHTIQHISSKNLDERIKNINRQDELGQLALSFNNLLDRLESSFIRERQFIGDVAHELKTPLATMKTSLEVALSKARTSTEYQHVLAESLTDINHLSNTLTDVLDLAWSEAHINQKFTRKLNLSELVTELTEIMATQTSPKKINVQVAIKPGIVVFGQRDKLARAILNLLENAVKYSKKRGWIAVSLKSSENKVFLTIEDTGVGIPADELQSVLERFYRARNTNRIQGSGLGLSISNSIIKIHAGLLKITSKENHGTKIEVILPLASS